MKKKITALVKNKKKKKFFYNYINNVIKQNLLPSFFIY